MQQGMKKVISFDIDNTLGVQQFHIKNIKEVDMGTALAVEGDCNGPFVFYQVNRSLFQRKPVFIPKGTSGNVAIACKLPE